MKRSLYINSGFTLMEVLVSVFIMAIVIMIVLPTYTSIMESKSMMERSGVRQMREAQALFSLLKEDLKSAFISNSAGEIKFELTNNRDFEGKSSDELNFTSFSHPVLGGVGAVSDQCEIGYFVKGDGEKKTLYRRVSRVIDEDITEGGEIIKLTDSIDYFDIIADSRIDLNTDAGDIMEDMTVTKFPGIVTVRLGLRAPDDNVKEYMTAFDMPNYIEVVKKEEPETEPKEGEEDSGSVEDSSDASGEEKDGADKE